MLLQILVSTLLLGTASAHPLFFPSFLPRGAYSNAANQLLDGTPCRTLTIIFARGTFEQGNVGTLTGPPFFDAVANIIGDDELAVQGVDYAADLQGYEEGGDPEGSRTMLSLIQQAASQCPKTKLVISGYSQGAQLVHKAAESLGDLTDSISSVVVFGDPDQGQAVGDIDESKVKSFCHLTDSICHGISFITEAHLTYSINAQQAAEFVVGQAGLS